MSIKAKDTKFHVQRFHILSGSITVRHIRTLEYIVLSQLTKSPFHHAVVTNCKKLKKNMVPRNST